MKVLVQFLLLFCLSFFATVKAHSQIYVDPSIAGENWGSVQGLLMFRGNPQRNFYGTGPLSSTQPQVKWRYPDKPMCAKSCVGSACQQWCGSGWTGQPVVRDWKNGVTEVIFGAYDRHVHFVNAETGKASRKPFPTGDIIKGSVTMDPDGFPLLYFGSRDNKYRILALEGAEARELWSMDGNDAKPRVWNDDWDANGIIINDYLLVGGENSWFYIVKLNRKMVDGKVTVNPKKIIEFPTFSAELRALTGDQMTSLESSPVVFKDRVYFANSSGYVVGLSLSQITQGKVEKVFEFWAGDDIDGTPVVDNQGFLYLAVELELDGVRARSKSAEQVRNMGQLIKLDPYKPSPPLSEQVKPASQHPSVVWKQHIPAGGGGKGGIWSTPAIDTQQKIIYVTTHPGDLKAFDTQTGKELWSRKLGSHEWSSPAIVDGHLLVGKCAKPGIELFNLQNPTTPTSVWEAKGPTGCVESTPAVWNGNFYVGSRDGYFYGFK